MSKQSLREEATALMETLEHSELEQTLKKDKAPPWTTRAVTALLNALSDADADAARLRVEKLRDKYPDESDDDLVERIIKKKSQQTAAIGAASSSAAIIPAIGTLSAMTVGVAADITATFKLQAEMVLEIASVYTYPLDQLGEQKLIFLVTGVSTGSNVLFARAGKELTVKLSERYAQKWLATALPFIGVAANSSTNALATYIIGQRAKVYFKEGPEAVASWQDSLRTLVGMDERKLTDWLAETSGKTWEGITQGVQSASEVIAAGASKTAEGVTGLGETVGAGLSSAASGVKTAAQTSVEFVKDTGSSLADKVKRPKKKRKSTSQKSEA